MADVSMRPLDDGQTQRPATLEGESLTAEELARIPIFSELALDKVKIGPLLKDEVARQRYQKGDVICQEGEGGNSAFYILSGQVQIFIARRTGTHTTAGKGLIARLTGWLGGGRRDTHPASKVIPLDATADLTYGQQIAVLREGDLFGEMSCRNNAPRSATVVADSDCELIAFARKMYEQLEKTGSFKTHMDAVYRERALSTHLRNIPLLDGILDDAGFAWLRENVQLITRKSGEIIIREGQRGDDPDTGGMYLVRLGQVRVSRMDPGGERVLNYLHKGDSFGAAALLDARAGADGQLAATRRNATCAAYSHHPDPTYAGKLSDVELVRIPPPVLGELLQRYPTLRGRLERLEKGEYRGKGASRPPRTMTDPSLLPQVEGLGLLQGQNLMLIDLERCTRCDQCVDACVAAHDDGLPRLVREGPRFDKYLVPASCRLCLDPVCLTGCPVGSIRRGEDLHIYIEDWCIGCETCAKQCPYDSIQMHPLEDQEKGVQLRVLNVLDRYGPLRDMTKGYGDQHAVVCDQCNTLSTGPACVYACPHDAALRVNASTFFSDGLANLVNQKEGYDREPAWTPMSEQLEALRAQE